MERFFNTETRSTEIKRKGEKVDYIVVRGV